MLISYAKRTTGNANLPHKDNLFIAKEANKVTIFLESNPRVLYTVMCDFVASVL